MSDKILSQAEVLSNLLMEHKLAITTVESCTGGLLAAVFTQLSGSSRWFDRGFVTYSNQSKIQLVGVRAETLQSLGAVSRQAAGEMAQGGVTNSEAQCAISITGIAGPGGGTDQKPVGTVYFGWTGFGGSTEIGQSHFTGDRQAVREQSVKYAIEHAIRLLQHSS